MRKIIVLAGLVGMLPMTATAQLAKPVIDKTASGIPRVMSAGPTAWKDTLGWKLVLDHTIQPPDGSAGELAKPRDVAMYFDGRVAVREEEPSKILLFDAKGGFLHTIGREGAGPGEFRNPFISATRDRLLIQDTELKRASLFTLDGVLIRSFPSTCCNEGPEPFMDDHARIRTAAFGMKDGKGRSWWMVFDSLGRRVDSVGFPLAVTPKEWHVTLKGGSASYSIPLAPVNRNIPLGDGTLLHGRTDRYEIMVTRNGVDTVRIFGRTNVPAVTIPSSYRDSLFHVRTERIVAMGAKVSESDMATVFDLWNDLAVDGAQNVWVSTGGRRAGPAHFDVFAPSGAYLGAVPAPWGPGLQTSWAGDRVAVIDDDANDLPRVRVFRIVRK